MKNNNKIYIILSIFTLVSLFLVVFFIWPLMKEIKESSKTFVSAKNSIVALAIQAGEIENFKKNYETYKLDLEKIDQLFVDPNNPVDFIEFLENTSAVFQITSQISLPPVPRDSKQVTQNFIIVRFSSTGGFQEILNFAQKIETGPYLIGIENLSIQPDSKNQSSNEFNAVFTIKAFTKK